MLRVTRAVSRSFNTLMSLVVPAVLPSSRADLAEKLERFAKMPKVARVQIDVVDGRFATPASWPYSAKATQGTPYPELEAMVQGSEMLPHLGPIEYEIDLMCLDADRAAGEWLALGASRLTFHLESIIHPRHFFESVHARYGGEFLSFGIALNISTDLASLEPYLPYISYVQFMGIDTIGRQGQPFNRYTLDKVGRFRKEHPEIAVQVDGGVSLPNAQELVALGVTNLIVGSDLLHASDPVAEMEKFESLRSPFGV